MTGDGRVHNIDLQCPPGRRVSRRLVVNNDQTQCLVWWNIAGHEVFPWSPQLKEEDRANMAVISWRQGDTPAVLGYHRTSSDPVYFRFLSDSLHYLGQHQTTARQEPFLGLSTSDSADSNTLML